MKPEEIENRQMPMSPCELLANLRTKTRLSAKAWANRIASSSRPGPKAKRRMAKASRRVNRQ